MILFFDDGNDFDNKLKISLLQDKRRLIVINLKYLSNWKFFLRQEPNQKLHGFIACPLNKIYDLSYITGMYLNPYNFSNYFKSSYECSSWHSMFTWLAFTLPNKLCNITSLNHYSKIKIMSEISADGINIVENKETHHAHIIAGNLFASTTSLQMAILPPTIAKKLIQTLNKNQIDQGQFYLCYNKNRWHICDFSPNPKWSECAFPNEFVFQSVSKYLSQKKQSKWHRCDFTQTNIRTTFATENYISNNFIPSVTGSYYEPLA